ncbi:MAG: hypothetical protein B5766_11170 [Candidatus Lumbricidophila eiseniae]|uniref:VIT family protein n=1 Tax=Candidatus Lumbricidiphila eiseniae TaxID=1969409 RepID=A0A2A6FPE4_9MICO|nr:MAG: hypothetical protein B5766_11170 [Candidatus Lumbricidophila eiseniae]
MTTAPGTGELPSDQSNNNKLNKLRAAVLGANDGIVSVASVVMGVLGATSDHAAIAMAGLAALAAGALSMAVGEYVSVSSQSDAEKADINRQRHLLSADPSGQRDELAREYMKQGVSEATARQVATELSRKDPLRAHLRVHFNPDPNDINNAIHAATASFVAFTVGGLIPFLAMVLSPGSARIPATLIAVGIALFTTGYLSSAVGKTSRPRAILRVMMGGAGAMAITYVIGLLFGTTLH